MRKGERDKEEREEDAKISRLHTFKPDQAGPSLIALRTVATPGLLTPDL